MYGRRILDVLVVALTTICVAQAIIIDPIFRTHNALEVVKRQKTGTPDLTGQATNIDTSTTPPTTSSTSQLTSSTPTSSSQSTSSPSRSSSSPTMQSSAPTSTPTPTPTPTPTHQSTSLAPESTSTTSISSTSSEPQTTQLTTVTSVVTTVQPDGVTSVYTTSQVATTTPNLASSQGSGQTGMTPQTRSTVIGVVVGLGGAIVLAGVAFLVFRLYRKRQPEEADGLIDYNSGYTAAEKSDVASSTSQTGRSPFQSTLESYHAPTQVNTASNF